MLALQIDAHQQDMLSKAYYTALTTLKDRYTPKGIQAGKSHFSDLWIRDSCFASLGSLSVGDYDVVKHNIETMLSFQAKDGQIPLRVGQKWMVLKFLGIDATTPAARFKEDKEISIPTDSNSLLLIIIEKYLQKTNDKSLILYHFNALKKAVEWNFSRDLNHDLLMEEGYYAGWADSLKKNGTVLYTNVLHYKAVQSFAYCCEYLGKTAEAKHYTYLAGCIKDTINRLFWNGDYYVDWVDLSGKPYDYFSTDGNVLAIIFGCADAQQSSSIQKYVHQKGLDEGFSTLSVYPHYERKHIYSLFLPLGMGDYHNGLQWLWIGCVDAVSKHTIGLHKEALALMSRIATKIVEHNGVYEVYDEGNPVKRLFYKSEQWFAWSAGLFVWACHQIGFEPKMI
jgi:glycogen debranching enzyme